MSETVAIGAPPIQVHVKRSSRARRYSLRVSNASGQVNLTLPSRASLDDALDFAARQEEWLRRALSKHPALITPEFGATFLFEGLELALKPGTGRRVQVCGDTILIPGHSDTLTAKLRGFCKVRARDRLVERSWHYARKINKEIGRVTIRDTRSRWGSCTQAGNLMYSWRLIMAPPVILDYVAAHEVAHLVEMNHSRAFWAVVAEIMPDYAIHRKWLTANGALLHRYTF